MSLRQAKASPTGDGDERLWDCNVDEDNSRILGTSEQDVVDKTVASFDVDKLEKFVTDKLDDDNEAVVGKLGDEDCKLGTDAVGKHGRFEQDVADINEGCFNVGKLGDCKEDFSAVNT